MSGANVQVEFISALGDSMVQVGLVGISQEVDIFQELVLLFHYTNFMYFAI